MDKLKLPEFEYLAVPLSPDDLLELTTVAVSFPITLEIEGTALDKSGNLVPFRFIQDISATVTPTTNQFRLGYQALLSVVVHTHTATIPDGDCYCHLTLVKSASRGVFPHRKVLALGYVSTIASIGYGSSSINGAPTQHFFQQNISIAAPATGSDFAFVTPNHSYLKIKMLTLTFQSDATAGNRIIRFSLTLPPGNLHFFGCPTSHAASSTKLYFFGADGFLDDFTMSNFFLTGMPSLTLTPGTTLSSSIKTMQATDQISDIALLVERTTVPT